jgi:hypothetical protein
MMRRPIVGSRATVATKVARMLGTPRKRLEARVHLASSSYTPLDGCLLICLKSYIGKVHHILSILTRSGPRNAAWHRAMEDPLDKSLLTVMSATHLFSFGDSAKAAP